ncbi:protein Mis18-beta [Lates calcarifer]|uniref:Opa interacting protein 5 n=1 Tax=Lates calcarifer TaxID=8187 RepID=A0A4W6FEJ3_LATCA|nr:protein Mis18-beta [Lates calcarifer]
MEYDESLLMQRVDGVKLAKEAEYGQPMTLHCAQCNTVLGDSVGVCGEIQSMDAIMCLRVTSDVVISDAMESGRKGDMVDCIYSSLKCRGCRCAVGKVIHSAPLRLAMIRSLFLLYKANISCYILNTSSMVEASTLTFDLKPLRQNIKEARQQFEAQLDQMSHVKSRLADRSVSSELVK